MLASIFNASIVILPAAYFAIAFATHLHYHWSNPQALQLQQFDRKLAAPVEPPAVEAVEIPAAIEPLEVEPAAIAAETAPNWSALDSIALRKELSDRAIQWRNAHGKGKHLKKAEMLELLAV